MVMNSEIARIHREGVMLELEQLGLKLGSMYSQKWFEKVWHQHNDTKKSTYHRDGKMVGFGTKIDSEVMLYVDQEYHRKGIGSVLIGNTTEVWVIEGNKMAEGFYTKNGFHKTPKSRRSVIFGHEVTENLWGRHETN